MVFISVLHPNLILNHARKKGGSASKAGSCQISGSIASPLS